VVFLRARDVGLDFPITHLDQSQSALAYEKSGRPSRFIPGKRGYFMRALENIDLDLKPGDRLALIGANGAGKTTLLRVLAGIYPPTAGEVEWSGRVGMMFTTGLGFDPRASGYENIYTTGLMLGLSPQEISDLQPEIEEFTELGEFLSLPLAALSAGMQARLAFAVTTCVRPDILLIDEVVGAGDPRFMAKARRRMVEVASVVRIVVLASQSLDVLKTFCNQAVRLVEGQIVERGSVDEVYRNYTSSAPTLVPSAEKAAV
jgi:ABC-2 type transport system ATP-binding protein/lipopolysaccharide transport system ATP-binding protein